MSLEKLNDSLFDKILSMLYPYIFQPICKKWNEKARAMLIRKISPNIIHVEKNHLKVETFMVMRKLSISFWIVPVKTQYIIWCTKDFNLPVTIREIEDITNLVLGKYITGSSVNFSVYTGYQCYVTNIEFLESILLHLKRKQYRLLFCSTNLVTKVTRKSDSEKFVSSYTVPATKVAGFALKHINLLQFMQ